MPSSLACRTRRDVHRSEPDPVLAKDTLWRSPTSVASARRRLAEIDGQLRSLKLSYEEWEILFRERLLIELQLSGAAP